MLQTSGSRSLSVFAREAALVRWELLGLDVSYSQVGVRTPGGLLGVRHLPHYRKEKPMAESLRKRWVTVEQLDVFGTTHVMPENDIIGHEMEDCACLPVVEPNKNDNGAVGWLVSHSAWDGRKN